MQTVHVTDPAIGSPRTPGSPSESNSPDRAALATRQPSFESPKRQSTTTHSGLTRETKAMRFEPLSSSPPGSGDERKKDDESDTSSISGDATSLSGFSDTSSVGTAPVLKKGPAFHTPKLIKEFLIKF